MRKKVFILILIGIIVNSVFYFTTSKAVEKTGYVIIALTDKELQVIEPLAIEKEQEGYEVFRLSMQKEKLKTSLEVRNFLQDKFKTRNFESVFFSGDVPIEEVIYNFFDDTQGVTYKLKIVSDSYYSLEDVNKPDAKNLFSIGRIPSRILSNWFENRKKLSNISKITLGIPPLNYEANRDEGYYWLAIDPAIEANEFKFRTLKKYDFLKINTLFEVEGFGPSEKIPDFPLNEENFNKTIIESDVVIAVSSNGPVDGKGKFPIVNGKQVNYLNLKRNVWIKKSDVRPKTSEIEVIDYCKSISETPKICFLSTPRPLESKDNVLYPRIDFLDDLLSRGSQVVLGNGNFDIANRANFVTIATKILEKSDKLGSWFNMFSGQTYLLPPSLATIIYGDPSQKISFEKAQEKQNTNIDLNFQRGWKMTFQGDVNFDNLPSSITFTKNGNEISFALVAPAVFFRNKPIFIDCMITFDFSDQNGKGVITVKYKVFNFGALFFKRED